VPVLWCVAGVAIACDGTVPFRSGERIGFNYLVSQVQPTSKTGLVADGWGCCSVVMRVSASTKDTCYNYVHGVTGIAHTDIVEQHTMCSNGGLCWTLHGFQGCCQRLNALGAVAFVWAYGLVIGTGFNYLVSQVQQQH
jgi:hypothetical protein